MKTNSTYENNPIKTNFLDYIIYGKSNEKKLCFGECPLFCYTQLLESGKDIFQNNTLSENKICTEILDEKIQKNLKELIVKMSDISINLSKFPIFNYDLAHLKETKKNIFTTKNENPPIKYEEEENLKGFICDICIQVFHNGQGLGWHMSRKHTNQSVKYKFKKETREKIIKSSANFARYLCVLRG